MRTPKIRDNNQWIIPRTYVRIGGVWVLVNNYIRDAGDWGNELVIYVTTTTTNLNVQTLFEATYPGSWASTAPKRLVINSGVIIGATDTSNYALNIPSGFGSTVRIDNSGSIQGAGGAANSGTGGNAIFAGASGISINNQGFIYAGGGGGGQGGQGGDGTYLSGATTVSFSAGGTGGSGGVGQGYSQNNTAGTVGNIGSPFRVIGGVPSTGAGRGGTGGTGGTFGNTGNTGNTGATSNTGNTGRPGIDGGLAGFYIVNNVNVTWINTGTVAGRVG